MRETKPDNRVAIARLIGGLKCDARVRRRRPGTAAAGDPDAKVRAACLAALVQVAEPAQASRRSPRPGRREPSVRLVAAARLRSLGPAAAPAAKQLAAALADADQRVREKPPRR